MRKPFEGPFPISQNFNDPCCRASYAKFGLNGHNGIDYALPTGTNVIAPHAGKVIEVAYDATGYGTYIKIENDIEGSVLAHLKESHVSIGDTVTEGQLIAKSDNTGNSTGPHLHWGYYRHPRNRANGFNGFIDPLRVLEQLNFQENQTPITDENKLLADEFRKIKAFNSFYENGDRVLDDLKKAQATEKELREQIDALDGKLQEKIKDYEKLTISLQTQIDGVIAEQGLECQKKLDKQREDLLVDHQHEVDTLKQAIDVLKKEGTKVYVEKPLSERYVKLEGNDRKLAKWKDLLEIIFA